MKSDQECNLQEPKDFDKKCDSLKKSTTSSKKSSNIGTWKYIHTASAISDPPMQSTSLRETLRRVSPMRVFSFLARHAQRVHRPLLPSAIASFMVNFPLYAVGSWWLIWSLTSLRKKTRQIEECLEERKKMNYQKIKEDLLEVRQIYVKGRGCEFWAKLLEN